VKGRGGEQKGGKMRELYGGKKERGVEKKGQVEGERDEFSGE
jgi:hypothetical protein